MKARRDPMCRTRICWSWRQPVVGVCWARCSMGGIDMRVFVLPFLSLRFHLGCYRIASCADCGRYPLSTGTYVGQRVVCNDCFVAHFIASGQRVPRYSESA